MKSGANSEDVSPELVCLAGSTVLEHSVKTILAFLTGEKGDPFPGAALCCFGRAVVDLSSK